MSDSKQIPLSLGKPSLRVRLEAYYSLIEPSRLRDKTSWRKIVDEIYKKYGGSFEGEKKLSSRLVKKYGSNVKLLLAESSARESLSSAEATFPIENEQFEETWYNPSTKRDGGIDLFSEMLDPEAVLIASEAEVEKANPWLTESIIPILDNTRQFAKLLPVGDPLRQNPTPAKRIQKQNAASQTAKKQRLSQASHPFDIIKDSFQSGPCSVLYKFHRKKVCVVTRYVNAIRGQFTGVLVAFDKHMNLILRDVEETYSPRPIERHTQTNIEHEIDRRRRIGNLFAGGNGSKEYFSVNRRRMKQIMLRGDNVVSVYMAGGGV